MSDFIDKEKYAGFFFLEKEKYKYFVFTRKRNSYIDLYDENVMEKD